MKIVFILLFSFWAYSNPNTVNHPVKFEAKYFKSNKLVNSHQIDLVLESNSMEERCFFQMKETRKTRGKNKVWDCRFRSQKEIPNIAFKELLDIFSESHEAIKGKAITELEAFKADKILLFFNGKKTKQTYLELKKGKYEVSFKEGESAGLNLVKISLEIY